MSETYFQRKKREAKEQLNKATKQVVDIVAPVEPIKKAIATKSIAPITKGAKKQVIDTVAPGESIKKAIATKSIAPITKEVIKQAKRPGEESLDFHKAALKKAGTSISDNAGGLKRVLQTGNVGGSLGSTGESIAKAGTDINTAAVKAGKDYKGVFKHLGDPNTYKSSSEKGGGGRPQIDATAAIAGILGGGGSGGGGSGGPTSSGGRQISLVDNPTFDPRFKNAQTGLLTQLQDRAAGRGGPSLAEMQQKQAGNKAMQNTLGAVRAGTGSNAALAARTAALAGGNQIDRKSVV